MVSGNQRMGWDRPGRSALLGMIGAAMGIERTDEDNIMALERDIGLAMLVERSGSPFMDFHTVRAPSGTDQGWTARRQEVMAIKHKDNPMVSLREYRINIVILVTIWLRENSRFSLQKIASSLISPTFVMYMGRKACPLGLPVDPTIIDAQSPVEALMHRRENGRERVFLNKLPGRPSTPYIALDEKDAPSENTRVEYRADTLVNRERWQFQQRGEVIIPLI